VTTHPFCRELIRQFRKPLVSTSANLSGEPAPTDFDAISAEILENAGYVVQWEQSSNKKQVKPSGIIKIGLAGEIAVIRK
jgi:L-threonylcarbamoyladenylate synthase